jgi:hypothetical protein
MCPAGQTVTKRTGKTVGRRRSCKEAQAGVIESGRSLWIVTARPAIRRRPPSSALCSEDSSATGGIGRRGPMTSDHGPPLSGFGGGRRSAEHPARSRALVVDLLPGISGHVEPGRHQASFSNSMIDPTPNGTTSCERQFRASPFRTPQYLGITRASHPTSISHRVGASRSPHPNS